MRAEQSAKVIELEDFRKRRAEREATIAPAIARGAPVPPKVVWFVPVAPLSPLMPGWGFWLWPHG